MIYRIHTSDMLYATSDLYVKLDNTTSNKQHNNETTQQQSACNGLKNSLIAIQTTECTRYENYVMTVSNSSIVHINVVSFVIQSLSSTHVLSTHSTYFRQYSKIIGWNSLILYQVQEGARNQLDFRSRIRL